MRQHAPPRKKKGRVPLPSQTLSAKRLVSTTTLPAPRPSSTKPSNAANSQPSHLALNFGLPFPGIPGPTYRDLNKCCALLGADYCTTFRVMHAGARGRSCTKEKQRVALRAEHRILHRNLGIVAPDMENEVVGC